MTFAAIVKARDGLVAIADGWTHHRCRPDSDLFDAQKLVQVVVAGQPAVVMLAGRATIGNVNVAQVVIDWAGSVDCSKTGLLEFTEILAAEIAARGDAADSSYAVTELLTGQFKDGHSCWYQVAVDGIGQWTTWSDPGLGPIACIGGASTLAERLLEGWVPTALPTEVVAERLVSGLKARYAAQPEAFATPCVKAGGRWRVLRTNLDNEPLRFAIGPQSAEEAQRLERGDFQDPQPGCQ